MQRVIEAIDTELQAIADERELARVASVNAQANADAMQTAFTAIEGRWQALQEARRLLRKASA